MGLKEIKAAGEMAKLVADAANSMCTIKNTYQENYNTLLTSIQDALGAEKTLSNLTDDEVNAFFYGSAGDATAVTNTQIVISEWEKNIIQLTASVAILPVNDI